jgi:hypothetical protein
MKLRSVLSLLTLTVVVALVLILRRQNSNAADGDPAMGFLCFNRADSAGASGIVRYWRQDGKREAAVKKIIVVDWIFIAVYVLYLCGTLYARMKDEWKHLPRPRSWLSAWLLAGIACILLGAIIDVVQDWRIYSYVTSQAAAASLLWYTRIKWALLIMGVAPLLISLIPSGFFTRATLTYIKIGLGGLMKMIWTFFPSLLFIFLTIYCFWITGQGKDILVAFTEERVTAFNFNKARFIFFLVIGFWIYLTWYSSRIIAYIKKQHGSIKGPFLDNYPRLAGNACFLVLELAVLQSPILPSPLHSGEAFVILPLALLLLYFADRQIRKHWNHRESLPSHFWMFFAGFFVLVIVAAFLPLPRLGYLRCLLVLLILLHVIYLFYSNLHHLVMKNQIRDLKNAHPPKPANIFEHIMDYFCIPRPEAGYFKWFNRLSVVVIACDILAILYLSFAINVGPFPIVILGFSVLLGLSALVTAFSVRYSVNIHLLLFIAAFLGSTMRETHYVRTKDLREEHPPAVNGYNQRIALSAYLKQWLKRVPDKDTTQFYETYFILADGGASRSGYWTASVLGKIEDSSLQDPSGKFSDHLFCLSGTSGGGVGVATFYALLADKQPAAGANYMRSARGFLQQDFFTYTLARMLGPDYFFYLFPFFTFTDRAAALEKGFEEYDDTLTGPHYRPFFDQPFSQFKTVVADTLSLPILFVNTTRMQDGNPGLITNLQPDTAWFGQRTDVLRLLGSDSDVSMASAAILVSRFPYLSPAGRIRNQYFVDGGYFDNSGAGAVQELIRGMLDISMDSVRTDTIFKKIRRLRFRVLHIMNSPIDGVANLKAVLPIDNDLFAPLLTIVGAYDMQTTVNDSRLQHYLEDIQNHSHILTSYERISLYEDSTEWANDTLRRQYETEPPYSMNWFMSDTTRNRIDRRLGQQPIVREVIQRLK